MTLRERRHATVVAHVETENAHDFDATVRTFARPRYEVQPTSEALDGEAAVKDFLLETYRAFPDMNLVTDAIHHADDAVIVETTFAGTHLGDWRGLPPTRRVVRYTMCNVFVFEGDALVCERLNFDMLTILRQLGLADDPTSLRGKVSAALCHPVTVGSALRGEGPGGGLLAEPGRRSGRARARALSSSAAGQRVGGAGIIGAHVRPDPG